MKRSTVIVRDEIVDFPTYLPAEPDRNPMFLDKRVYQGSSGRVYPLPFIDRIADKPVPHGWRSITLENEFLEIQILPEIGGRIHRLRDKTNGYDAIYYQPVIKPALVGLAGPWIRGHPERVMPFCVRSYSVRSDDRVVAAVNENHQTRKALSFESPLITRSLTVEVERALEDIPTSILELRCYP